MVKFRSIAAMTDRLNEGAEHKTFTQHALRHVVRQAEEAAEKKGEQLSWITRLGSKILINEQGFNRWLENH